MSVRDEHLAAVRARLAAIETRMEFLLALEPEALLEAEQLAQVLHPYDMEGKNALGRLYWYRHLAAAKEQPETEDLRQAFELLAPHFIIVGTADLPEPLLPLLADRAAAKMTELFYPMLRSEQALVLEATKVWRRIVEATGHDHVDHAERLAKSATAHWVLFSRFGGTTEELQQTITGLESALDVVADHQGDRWELQTFLAIAHMTRYTGNRAATKKDLEVALISLTAAVDLIPNDHKSRPGMLHNLAGTLRSRYEHFGGGLDDLDRAIGTWQAAVETARDSSEWAQFSSQLADALWARYRRSGAQEDQDSAVGYWQAVVNAEPEEPEKVEYLSRLTDVLLDRYECLGAREDMDAALEAWRAVVDATDGPERTQRLARWASMRLARFESFGDRDDLNAAVETARTELEQIAADDPILARWSSVLAEALNTRFHFLGAVEDLAEALEHAQAALASVEEDDLRGKAAGLSSLGRVLWTRFEHYGGDQQDLDITIDYGREAVEIFGKSDSGRPEHLSRLAGALRTRFKHFGAQRDLDEAINALQEAVEATRQRSTVRATYLSNLCNAQRTRFDHFGDRHDADAAIENGQAAIDAARNGDPDRAMYLSNLGVALLARFERFHRAADQDDAVAHLEAAVQATPTGNSYRSGYIANLAGTLGSRFERTGDRSDLERAVTYANAAIDAAPSDDPRRPGYVGNLAAFHLDIADLGEQIDLDAVIGLLLSALNDIPADHPDKAVLLAAHGRAFSRRSQASGSLADTDAAFTAYAQAAALTTASPVIRIQAARAAASLDLPHKIGQAADLLEDAVRLLPQVAPRRLERRDRQDALGGLAGLAGHAAALALSHPHRDGQDNARRALQILESSRAVLLSQALDTRSDLTDLSARDEALARRFIEVRDRLDALSTGLMAAAAPDERRRLADELATVMTRIRAIDERFGLPPTVEELLAEAEAGPIVVFNISDLRCDALVLTATGITVQRLPTLTPAVVVDQVNRFYRSLHDGENPGLGLAARRAAQVRVREILEWLWNSITRPVLEETLGLHGPPAQGELPRVWWVPGGYLGLLPLHAAGMHNSVDGSTVMDRVVSSYTPTVRALGYSRRHGRRAAEPGSALVVAMPTTPGIPGRLDHVPEEAALLQRHVPDCLLLANMPGHPAELAPTSSNVLEALPGRRIAHFACHGWNDPADPSASRLLLQDHDAAPLTAASLAAIKLDRVQLAYLSACYTAITSTSRLLDEAIHLTSSFQLAGFPHVIGTLWQIRGPVALTVAQSFYAALGADDRLDTDKAATALHHAVKTERDRFPMTPSRWAAYLHAGA